MSPSGYTNICVYPVFNKITQRYYIHAEARFWPYSDFIFIHLSDILSNFSLCNRDAVLFWGRSMQLGKAGVKCIWMEAFPRCVSRKQHRPNVWSHHTVRERFVNGAFQPNLNYKSHRLIPYRFGVYTTLFGAVLVYTSCAPALCKWSVCTRHAPKNLSQNVAHTKSTPLDVSS